MSTTTDTTRILVQVPRLEADDIVGFGRRIQQYLPSNYRLVSIDRGGAVILGSDRLGWTAEGYVLPRLASGLIFGKVD